MHGILKAMIESPVFLRVEGRTLAFSLVAGEYVGMRNSMLSKVSVLCWLVCINGCCVAGWADDGVEFFESRIRPLLVEHCYRCHSAESQELHGGLRLDLKSGWELGGDSGEPAIVRGMPDASPLLHGVRHDAGVSPMPPNAPKLPAKAIADLTAWIAMGAPDPREGMLERRDKVADWEREFERRVDWWSLKPVAKVLPPNVQDEKWARNDVDRFLLARLEQQGLKPVAEAGRRALARRLSFALTGLPPDPQLVASFSDDDSPQAYDALVTTLLDSPHYGERWARHWMDVVHYSDTHGYEWDVPAKNAWRYRDYLIRAFNADVPYRQWVLEQIAGDLIEPRLDSRTGLNESLIGPTMLRLGERRHGDNAAIEGVTQEAVANMIDTLGKAFLGTTLACAQCHDHKLDAIEQRDYYSLAGMLMSTRFSARSLHAIDPNEAILERLRAKKLEIRQELARLWRQATDVNAPGGAVEKLRAIAADEPPASGFPASLVGFWKRSLGTTVTADEFLQERQRRIEANQTHLTLLADFSRPEREGGWRWEGLGMKHGLVEDGELVVADEGEIAIVHLLPAGRFSHVWSSRLAGSLQSPQMDPMQPITFSIEAVAGKLASQSFVVDRALHPERLQFPNWRTLGWQTLTAGNFDSLEGSVDKAPRRVYFEMATKALNNYFPPRVGYGGAIESENDDPRSWFGATKVYQHPAGQPPQDTLERFVPLFEELSDETDWARRLVQLVNAAVDRWAVEECGSEDVRLLNDALELKWLTNDLASSPELSRLITEYRALEKELEPDCTVGSVAEWNEGRDERVGIRGSYVDFGDTVARGQVRVLTAAEVPSTSSSRRWEWAHLVADDRNPLTARVYVNRVWQYVFGVGLVRTPDDFGHLGEPPSHPELLDYLAQWFIDEGWSTKKLVRLLVSSAAWRQQSIPDPNANEVDPENRLWHHMPLRRLEAESIRDAMLTVSGRLDPVLFGPPIEPYRSAEDSQKRLFRGPLDGNGRRSIYTEMTLMEPPRFLAVFNQPIPKQTVGRRDVTNVPDQALALLNDPFVIEIARFWGERLVGDDARDEQERIERMLLTALGRPATEPEVANLVRFVRRSAELRGSRADVLKEPLVWQDAAHAIFNLKEFIYVR